jgi:hypothetical protein
LGTVAIGLASRTAEKFEGIPLFQIGVHLDLPDGLTEKPGYPSLRFDRNEFLSTRLDGTLERLPSLASPFAPRFSTAS